MKTRGRRATEESKRDKIDDGKMMSPTKEIGHRGR